MWKGIESNSLQNEILKNVFASDVTLAKMDDSRFGFIVLVLGQNGFVRHLFGKGLICDWNILKGKASDSPGRVPSNILNHHCLEKSPSIASETKGGGNECVHYTRSFFGFFLMGIRLGINGE